MSTHRVRRMRGPEEDPRGIALEWWPDRPYRLRPSLGAVRRGGGDPTWREVGGGILKGWSTPEGPATVLIRQVAATTTPVDHGSVRLLCWGPGAGWVLDRMPRMLGADDDDAGFATDHPLLDRLARTHVGWRVPATGLLVESLVPSIIEQKVTGAEAFTAYRRLVRRFGRPAPGPAWVQATGLMVAPDPAGWASIPSWEFALAGLDSQRADTVMRALAVAPALQSASGDLDQSRTRLAAVPGIGRWTIAEVAHTALGDPDAVSFGDYHVARNVSYALTGEIMDDDGLEELLLPYAGHRYRVQRLVELAGLAVPRRGARRTLPTHLPRPF